MKSHYLHSVMLFSMVMFGSAFGMAGTLGGCAGCTQQQKEAWKRFGEGTAKECLQPGVVGAAEEAGAQLLEDLNNQLSSKPSGAPFDQQVWQNLAQGIGSRYGFTALACAASQLVKDFPNLVNGVALPNADGGMRLAKRPRPPRQDALPYLLAIRDDAAKKADEISKAANTGNSR